MSGLGFVGGDEVGALVLDVGANSFKAGYGGEDTPKLLESSYGGIAEDSNRSKLGLNFYRKDFCDVKPCMTFENRRVCMDNDVFRGIVDYAFRSKRGLPITDLTNHPIILTEPNRQNPAVRKAMFETLFEDFNSPAVFTLRKSVAACFANGRGSGLVVDIGASHLSVSPVFEGFSLQKSTLEYPVGGDLFDACIDQLLHKKAVHVPPRFFRDTHAAKKTYLQQGRLAVIKDLKHEMCKVQVDSAVQASYLATWSLPVSQPEPFELPDGTKVDVSSFSALIPELLFESYPLSANPLPGMNPDIGGFQGLVPAIGDVVNSVDIDIRKIVGAEIILVGGSSCFSKLPERLQKCNPLPAIPKLKITAMPAAIDRTSASWLGCSIAASLGSFQHLWVSKQIYHEHGSDRLLDKQIIF